MVVMEWGIAGQEEKHMLWMFSLICFFVDLFIFFLDFVWPLRGRVKGLKKRFQ